MRHLYTVVLALLLFSSAAFAQAYLQKGAAHAVRIVESMQSEDSLLTWVYFNDKGPGAFKMLSQPEQLVSKRALERRRKVRPEHKLVDFADLPVYEPYVEQLIEAGAHIRHRSKWFNAVSCFLSPAEFRRVAGFDFVGSLDNVKSYKRSAVEEEAQPAGAKKTQPSGVHSLDYGNSFLQLDQINVPPLHDLGLNGAGVRIGVFDAGFNFLEHESLVHINLVDQYDFVNNDANTDDEEDQGSGRHGTRVLSVMAGFKEGQLIGPAYNAEFVLAKTENTEVESHTEEDNFVAAIEWAEGLGVDIISSSIGYLDGFVDGVNYTWQDMNGETTIITLGADMSVERGVVQITSAGNGGYNADRNTLSAPSDGFNVVAVGGLNSANARHFSSSVGNTADGRIKPDIMALGSGVHAAATTSANLYQSASGTSFAAPLAAGVAALLLQQHPDYTPEQVRTALRMTAANSATPNREYGWGRINALAALEYEVSGVDGVPAVPASFTLYNNFPNPFNPSTSIKFDLPASAFVNLSVYDASGSLVQTLINRNLPAGTYYETFSADGLASGVYFARITAGGTVRAVKMVVLR